MDKMTNKQIIAALAKDKAKILCESNGDNNLIIESSFFVSSFNYGMFVGARWMQKRLLNEE